MTAVFSFLAWRPSVLLAVGATRVDGIVTGRAAIAQDHPATALSTNGDALQQGRSIARHTRMAGLIAVNVVCQSSLVLHELLPVNVPGIDGLWATLPVRDGELNRLRAIDIMANSPVTTRRRP
ncbi:hypothetical protein X726_31870 [Mesorhizobium sp. L103C105A0]|nr:hypothetical protein X726_31870 [Mesorhizobium sp. L103C105A0]